MSPTGYSGTPLAQKLGFKPGHTVYLENAPANYAELVTPLPANISFATTASGVNLIHLFSSSAVELSESLPRFLAAIRRDGMIWVLWPKRASKMPTDITEDVIREIALPLGLVDVKVCAVYDVWSGLKLVIRKELR